MSEGKIMTTVVKLFRESYKVGSISKSQKMPENVSTFFACLYLYSTKRNLQKKRWIYALNMKVRKTKMFGF